MPLNMNGKLDRKALSKLVQLPGHERLEPEEEAEVAWVLNAVADILDVPIPTATDDFFSLGGTSLHAAFLIGRIEKERNRTIDFAELFETSNLGAIARLIHEAPEAKTIHIERVGEKPGYELSPQQRRWWNIYLPERNRSWATMVRLIHFEGNFSKIVIQRALFDIVAAQEALQLFFTRQDGRLLQYRHRCEQPDEIQVVEHHLSSENDETSREKLNDIRLAIANEEIDPFIWPLFRMHALSLRENRTNLIFAIHHMISDGFSMELIEIALRNALEKKLAYTPQLPFGYLSYANWASRREMQSFGPGTPSSDYWQDVFREPYEKIEFLEQWKGEDHDRGSEYCEKVPDEIREGVAELARREKLTVFSVYLAAKFLAWHSMLNCNDIVIGTPAAGRDIPGTEEIMGNFISLVCVRSKNPNWEDLIGYARQIMRSVARAMMFQSYQFDRLVSSLGLKIEQDRFPLTTIFISYLNFEAIGHAPLSPIEVGHIDLGYAVKFDLMAYVREHKGATSIRVQYRRNLFRSDEVVSFVKLWLQTLARVVNKH
jgi:hypothetical protein